VPYNFMIWNQGNDGRTMGIRAQDVGELARFAAACSEPDISGQYTNMQQYLNSAGSAHGAPPPPYSRIVDVIWLNPIGYSNHRLFPSQVSAIA
jgi:hypothetical protein